MQRRVSPIVAIVVILVVVAAVAFVWMKLTVVERPQGPGVPGPPAQMGSRRGGRQPADADSRRASRRGRRGGGPTAEGQSPSEAAPGATEAGEGEG